MKATTSLKEFGSHYLISFFNRCDGLISCVGSSAGLFKVMLVTLILHEGRHYDSLMKVSSCGKVDPENEHAGGT